MRKYLAMVLCFLTLCALVVVPATGAVSYAPKDAEAFFIECFRIASLSAAPCPSCEEVKAEWGYTVAEQYGNCVRYFWDTGDTMAFTAARQLITTGAPFETEVDHKYTFAVNYGTEIERHEPIGPFADTPADAWYTEAVTAMAKSGIITGCDDGLFHPGRAVTEGELYAMLVRAGSYQGANIGGGNYGKHWASGILQTAEALSFCPPESGWEDMFATRGEAVTRIVSLHNKALEKGGAYKAGWLWKQKNNPLGDNTVPFESIPDSDAILTYIETNLGEETPEQFAYAYSTGIAKGVDEAGNFNPTGTLTRAEVAQMFYNAGITARLNLFPRSKTSETLEVDLPNRLEADVLMAVEVTEKPLYDFTSREHVIK